VTLDARVASLDQVLPARKRTLEGQRLQVDARQQIGRLRGVLRLARLSRGGRRGGHAFGELLLAQLVQLS
jgi:hypothetical protein